MAPALMVETFCLLSASASRILLPTAESWCCTASHVARCAPWPSRSSRPTSIEAFSPGRVAAHEGHGADLQKANELFKRS